MHNRIMEKALEQAKLALLSGDVPVGAVVVYEGRIIACAHNEREKTGDPTAHAEVLAIRRAAEALQRRRLNGCTLYVTLEPCPMCAGAIVNSRIERVVFGAYDAKAGSFGTMINLTEYPLFKPEIVGGVLKDECASLLSEFFKRKR